MQQLIISDPAVMIGKPVIAGTRITELILEKLAVGETVEQILSAHVIRLDERIGNLFILAGQEESIEFEINLEGRLLP